VSELSGFTREELASAAAKQARNKVPKVAESKPRVPQNVPRGLYRNTLGAELRVTKTAGLFSGHKTLSGDIAIAEDRDELFGTTTTFLVTEASLKDCGYELIEPATEEA
jgi:hypothetical protein